MTGTPNHPDDGADPTRPFGPPVPGNPGEQWTTGPTWQDQGAGPGSGQGSGAPGHHLPPGPQGWQQGWQPGPVQPYHDPLARSRVAAGVLGILIGSLGVHNFYTGYLQTAWIQLGCTLGAIVLTVITFGLFSPIASVVVPGIAIWGLVEGILFLTQRTGHYSTDATGRPLRD